MKVLAKLLLSTQVSSLIKSKGSKKSQLITLTPDATIRTALMTFVKQDISAIPIRSDNQDEFLGMFNITDILRYILKDAPESFYKQDISTLLNRPISAVIKECGIRKVKIIRDQLNLMRLLFDQWGNVTPIDHKEIDCKHLLVKCGIGKYEVVTPTDLIRYILLLSRENDYLRRTKASEVPCGFLVNESKSITGDDDAWFAFKKLLDSVPFYILGVVDRDTGKLEANLSAIDFIPASLALSSSSTASEKSISLEEAISMLRRPGLSLYTFIRATKLFRAESDLDPICLQPHFTIADIVEKMTIMKIHQLWRVSQDRERTPIGIVGICDVIKHFCKIFEPFKDADDLIE